MSETHDDLVAIDTCRAAYDRIHAEMAKVVVGQRDVIDDVLMSLFCDSHILLVGVPGLAKTLLIATLAKVLKLDFKRVQFTPDLLPGDITGSEVIEEDRATGRREFRFVNGPVFTNLLLAEDPGRAPAGDAGTRGQRRPADAQAAQAVSGHGHAESTRAGGHLPSPRGAARPVHV
jgi:MoxR-like ATPase